MPKQFTLGTLERLKSRKRIEQLFAEGKKLLAAPFRVHYLLENGSTGLVFGTGVSAKTFKKAVDRNRIKRLTREAFRLQKVSLRDKLHLNNKKLEVFFIYTGKELPDYNTVYQKLGQILEKLERSIDK